MLSAMFFKKCPDRARFDILFGRCSVNMQGFDLATVLLKGEQSYDFGHS